MKKDDLQTTNGPNPSASPENASNSNNTMAKLKGLDKMKVNKGMFTYLFCQGPCGLTLAARIARTPSTMKTAPLLRKKVSNYTSQCDQVSITVVVCVIRISICNKDRRFMGESAKQRSVVASQQTL